MNTGTASSSPFSADDERTPSAGHQGQADKEPSAGTDHTLYDRLWALARNLWWTWHPEVISFFSSLDPIRWRQLDHNPIALLSELTAERLEQRTNELVLGSQINYAYRRLQEYLRSDSTWGATHAGVLRVRPVTTSRRSSACTSRCRSTPAASASWPGTTSRAPATWASPW